MFGVLVTLSKIFVQLRMYYVLLQLINSLSTRIVTLSLHLTGLGGGIGLGSVGVNPENPGSGRVRACSEAVLVNHLQRHIDGGTGKATAFGSVH